MKLRTSFFDGTVLRKDITRFAPLWGFYSILVALYVIIMWEAEATPVRFANIAGNLMSGMAIVNFIYAPLIAFLVFGDLFKPRMCYGLHSLPLRREGWFLTHVTSGLMMGLIPNAVAGLLCAAVMQDYAYTALLWLAVMALEFLFFFGVSVFSVHCSGNGLGALAIYGIIQFAAFFAGWFWDMFYQPLLFGTVNNFEKIIRYSPVIGMTEFTFIDTHYDNMRQITYLDEVMWEQWRYAGIAAGVGVVFLGLALLLYRKRQLEKAGDLLAFRAIEPIFLMIFTLCGGATLYLISEEFDLGYLFLGVGFVVCFFGGKMLIERRTKVFCGKNFRMLGILAAVFAASIGITALDPFGVETYVPEVDNIQKIEIYSKNERYKLELTTEESLTLLTDIHRDCIQERTSYSDYGYEWSYSNSLGIRYTLKNGIVVERYYYLIPNSENYDLINMLLTKPKAVFGTEDPTQLLSGLQKCEIALAQEEYPLVVIATEKSFLSTYDEKSATCYITDDPVSDPILSGLLDAMIQDCAEGNLKPVSRTTKPTYAHVYFDNRFPNVNGHYIIDESCVHTIAHLKSLQTESENP